MIGRIGWWAEGLENANSKPILKEYGEYIPKTDIKLQLDKNANYIL